MFEAAGFCATCGTARARAAGDETPALKCPGCRTSMQPLRIGATELRECSGCDGIWLDAAAFERLCADSEARAALLHRLTTAAAPREPRVKYRPCPRCGKMMNRVNFARISGIVVDVCRTDGTYLDPGELHAILQFITAGGLERARERQLQELKEQERRALEAERRAARERGRSEIHHHRGPGLTWSFLIGGGKDGE